jgi:hypothetical protein
MTRRNTILGGYPLRFEQREFGEAHENRVERAGLKSRFAAEFIAVAPGGGTLDETFQNAEGLRGEARSLHKLTSTYVDSTCQEIFQKHSGTRLG